MSGFYRAAATAVAVLALSPAAHALDSITVGKSVATSELFATLEVGEELGIWKEEGLALKILAFKGDAQMQQALTSNTIDFGLGSGPSMGFMAKGVPAIGVAAFADAPLNMAVLVAPNIGIKKIDDLKGKKIGVTSAGSLTYWLVKELSRQEHWTGADAVQPVPLGAMRTRLAAMKKGDIQGTVQTTVSGYELESQGVAKVFLVFGDMVKNFHTHIMFATKTIVKEKPDVVRRYLRGWFRTVAREKKDKALTVRVWSKVMHVKPEVVARVYDKDMAMLSDDGRFNPKAIETIRRSLVELKILPTEPDPKVMYTDRFVPVKF
jgi:ABC-type nitrate/sulfonate/bicarbonate transport system substrate-binding protein